MWGHFAIVAADTELSKTSIKKRNKKKGEIKFNGSVLHFGSSW